MAINTLSEALDNLYTTTWQNMRDKVADQIFNATPFWFWLKKNNKFRTVRGGRFLTEPLRYAKSDKVVFITKGGTVTLNDTEFLTVAKDEWRYLVDSIVRFWVDDQQNSGQHQIVSLMNAKLDNSRDSLIDQIETSLFASAGTAEFNGLQNLVADDPTTGTVEGINAATYSWWRNQFKNLTGLSWSVNGVDEMRTLYNSCSKHQGQDTPDIIVSGQTPYEYYEDSVMDQKQIVNKTLGDAGFSNIQFKGVPMVWSPACANTRMYFLNTKFLTFVYDPAFNFEMTEWKTIPDQVNDRAAQIVLAGNLMTSRRKVHGVIFNIDTE